LPETISLTKLAILTLQEGTLKVKSAHRKPNAKNAFPTILAKALPTPKFMEFKNTVQSPQNKT
jgi:hypothetical protein